MNLLPAFLLSFTSVVGYSLIAIYIGSVTKRYGAFWSGFWIQILGLPLTLVFAPFFGLNLAINIYFLAIAVFGIGISFGFILYCKSLSIGPVSVVQSILQLGTLITFFMAVIFLNESITIFKVLGSTMVIIASVMVSLDLKELFRKNIRSLTKALPVALLQAILNGMLFFILSIGTKHFDGYSASVGSRLFTVPTFLLVSLTQTRPQKSILKTSFFLFFFIALIDVVSYLFYNTAIQRYEVSFVTIIQGTIPVVTAIIAGLFFKEKLNLHQKLGIILAVIGVIVLGTG